MSVVEVAAGVVLPAGHGRDEGLHGRVAVALGDLRVAAREELGSFLAGCCSLPSSSLVVSRNSSVRSSGCAGVDRQHEPVLRHLAERRAVPAGRRRCRARTCRTADLVPWSSATTVPSSSCDAGEGLVPAQVARWAGVPADLPPALVGAVGVVELGRPVGAAGAPRRGPGQVAAGGQGEATLGRTSATATPVDRLAGQAGRLRGEQRLGAWGRRGCGRPRSTAGRTPRRWRSSPSTRWRPTTRRRRRCRPVRDGRERRRPAPRPVSTVISNGSADQDAWSPMRSTCSGSTRGKSGGREDAAAGSQRDAEDPLRRRGARGGRTASGCRPGTAAAAPRTGVRFSLAPATRAAPTAGRRASGCRRRCVAAVVEVDLAQPGGQARRASRSSPSSAVVQRGGLGADARARCARPRGGRPGRGGAPARTSAWVPSIAPTTGRVPVRALDAGGELADQVRPDVGVVLVGVHG